MTQTHTVDITAFATPSARSEAMQTQLAQIFERIDTLPDVQTTRNELEQVRQRLKRFHLSQQEVMRRASETADRIGSITSEIELALAHGAEPPALEPLLKMDLEHRILTRANLRLVERLVPEAEIDEMQMTATHLLSRAAALRQEAAGRIARTAQLMAEAAEFEGHIRFDPAQTLSGALTAHAVELETQADNYRRWAEERALKHEQVLRELDSLQMLKG